MTTTAELERTLGGFNPLKVLRWALRLARPLVKLNGTQAAAWDIVQALAEQSAEVSEL